MKALKHILTFFCIGVLLWSCGSSPLKNSSDTKEEPVVIANDSLEYEIIIIDIGFSAYLNSTAFPPGYYSQNYLENRNVQFVTNWNIRANNPARGNPNIYENVMDYQPTVDYGYDVNYKLFNYFLFAQNKYKMNLGYSNRRQLR